MASTSLTAGPLGPHIRRIALPLSIGFFFNTMYNVVDSFYAGQVSTEALAAMALAFPVFFIIFAVAEGIARGSSALIANAIGEEDAEKEERLTSQVYTLGFFVAITLTVVGLTVAAPLFGLMGATGNYLSTAVDYVHPLFWGSCFFLLSSLSNAILLAHGDSRTYSKVLIAGFFLNLVLDPWFLYGGFGLPAMGVAGIAWATVLIQGLGGLYLFVTLVRRGHLNLASLRRPRPNFRTYREILHQGVPASFNYMAIAIGFFVSTYFLNIYGEAAVAAFGVGTRIEQMALLPAIGLGAAIVSIVGQNNGARKYDRVRECVALCVRYGGYLIGIASIVMFAIAPFLVDLFTDDPEVLTIGTYYVRVMAFIQWSYVMGFIHIGFLQAVKRPMYAFAEATIRKILLPFPVFYLLVSIADVPLESFWFGMVGINVAMTLVTIAYAQWVLRIKVAPSQPG